MNLSIKDVETLAELAKLELTQDEKKSLLLDLQGILGYVDQIKIVALDDVEENYPIKNISRLDNFSERDFSKELILQQFPESQDGFLKVDKIL